MKYSRFILTAAVLLAGCQSTLSDKEAEKLAYEGAVMAYPLVESFKPVWAVMSPASPIQMRLNTVNVNTEPFSPEDRLAPSANTDLLYVGMMYDLREEPLIILVPEIKDRYYAIQLTDLFSNVFGYIGTQATGTAAGTYMLVSDKWQGKVPAQVNKVFRASSVLGMAHGRVLFRDKEDLKQAIAVARNIVSLHLSDFLVSNPQVSVFKSSQPQNSGLDPIAVANSRGLNVPDYCEPRSASAKEFFRAVAFMMQFQTFDERNRHLIEKLSRLGVVPGKELDTTLFKPLEAIERGLKRAREEIMQTSQTFGASDRGWMFPPRSAGTYAQNNMTRSALAYIHPYMNTVEEALYPTCRVDNYNVSLDGSRHAYVLEMHKDDLPPVKYFWSITLYDERTGFLYENEMERYSLGSLDKELKADPDGKVRIYVQNGRPSADKLSHWLPAPEGPFYLLLRLYGPKVAAVNGKWHPPVVQRVK